MKKTLLSVFASGLFLISTAASAAPQVYKIHVDGLACPFCAYGIENKLSAVAGVEKLDTDIATGTVTVTAAEGATLDETALRKAVDDAGFRAGKIERPAPSP